MVSFIILANFVIFASLTNFPRLLEKIWQQLFCPILDMLFGRVFRDYCNRFFFCFFLSTWNVTFPRLFCIAKITGKVRQNSWRSYHVKLTVIFNSVLYIISQVFLSCLDYCFVCCWTIKFENKSGNSIKCFIYMLFYCLLLFSLVNF